MIDKLIAVAEHKNIEPIIVITKSDIASAQEIFDIYTLAGFKTIIVSNETKDGVDEVKAVLKDKISALTGNSGVGKTSLLNNLDETLALKTAQISK